MQQSETQALTLREEDLTPRKPIARSKEPIDLEIVEQFRSTYAGLVQGKITPEAEMTILNVLEKGVSLETAASYALVSPAALKKYLEEGFQEANEYTQEMYDAGIELSPRAKFAMECMQRASSATVNMAVEFYDRCQEPGKEHLMLWMLERLDPQKYHLKKKVETNTNIDMNTHSVVEFKFQSPASMRPVEDTKLYDEKLDKLKQIYGDGSG